LAAAGSLDDIERLLKITVFVASTPDFTSAPLVADGASLVLNEVLGSAGPHARAAIGVAALPLGSPVEIEAIAVLRAGGAESETERR
jgi:enamine deaminase RidA (YjgF/YER057c/UK114 family)